MSKAKSPEDPPDDGMDPQTPPAPAAGATSAGIVRRGPKTKRELDLEKNVSKLEDEKTGLLEQVQDLTKIVDATRRIPSARQPGKTIWDEVNAFLGFGE